MAVFHKKAASSQIFRLHRLQCTVSAVLHKQLSGKLSAGETGRQISYEEPEPGPAEPPAPAYSQTLSANGGTNEEDAGELENMTRELRMVAALEVRSISYRSLPPQAQAACRGGTCAGYGAVKPAVATPQICCCQW